MLGAVALGGVGELDRQPAGAAPRETPARKITRLRAKATRVQAAIDRMNVWGRIPVCGAISTYNEETPPPGPRNFMAGMRFQYLPHFGSYARANVDSAEYACIVLSFLRYYNQARHAGMAPLENPTRYDCPATSAPLAVSASGSPVESTPQPTTEARTRTPDTNDLHDSFRMVSPRKMGVPAYRSRRWLFNHYQ